MTSSTDMWQSAADIGLKKQECGILGPRAEPSKVSGNAESAQLIAQLTHSWDMFNLLRGCDSSLRSSASGVRCLSLSFDATRRRHFPLSEEVALAWPSSCPPGRTSAVYIAHLEKFACFWVWAPDGDPGRNIGQPRSGQGGRQGLLPGAGNRQATG